MKNFVVHTRIDEKMLKALERLSLKEDRKKSELIRKALENFLGR